MVAVPADEPVTTPVVDTGATKVLLLLHTPPVAEVVSVVVKPTHRPVLPDMVAGAGLTVATVVIWQPLGSI